MTTPLPAPGRLGDVVLRPVRSHHAFESCVEQLATAIRLGAYPHGSSLPPERELAERLGVSRATLREAMAALRAAGMVRTRRGRGGGTQVQHVPPSPGTDHPDAPPALDGLLDVLAFRRVVEPGAAELAAGRELTTVERAGLDEALAQCEQAADDPGLHRQCDSRLHLTLASLTGSPRTLEAVTTAQAELHDLLQRIPVLPVNIEHSTQQHRAIVAAVRAGDPRRARRVMAEHCDDTAALLRGLLTWRT